jgi:hypothetical protein
VRQGATVFGQEILVLRPDGGCALLPWNYLLMTEAAWSIVPERSVYLQGQLSQDIVKCGLILKTQW